MHVCAWWGGGGLQPTPVFPKHSGCRDSPRWMLDSRWFVFPRKHPTQTVNTLVKNMWLFPSDSSYVLLRGYLVRVHSDALNKAFKSVRKAILGVLGMDFPSECQQCWAQPCLQPHAPSGRPTGTRTQHLHGEQGCVLDDFPRKQEGGNSCVGRLWDQELGER